MEYFLGIFRDDFLFAKFPQILENFRSYQKRNEESLDFHCDTIWRNFARGRTKYHTMEYNFNYFSIAFSVMKI